MKFITVACLYLTLLAAAAACPAATQPEPSTRRAVNFGQVLKLLRGKHPYLDLTQGSAMQSFHFTIGATAKQEVKGSLSAFHPIFVEARVVRDRKARAVILHFGEAYAYYTSDGSHSFLAMADPMDANHVLAARSGRISVGGFVTKPRAAALGLPGSEMFGITVSGESPIFLRVLDFIRAKMAVARKVTFRASPFPTLSLKWQRGEKDVLSLRVIFDLDRNSPFPVRKFNMTQRKRGTISTAWISGIGDGAVAGGPVIHSIKGIEGRAGLPWKNVSVMILFHRFLNCSHYLTGTPPSSKKYLLMRGSFIKWSITPDAALTTTHAVGNSASEIRKPKP
jgi:hypothetical protein